MSKRCPTPSPDEAGRPSRPYRRVDTLAAMLRKGTITAAMRQAGEDFHMIFVRAALDPLRAADLRRVRGGTRRLEESEAQLVARKTVWRTVEAVGGLASPAGSCCWHVLGLEWSIKDWALREGWGGQADEPGTGGGRAGRGAGRAAGLVRAVIYVRANAVYG